MIRTYLEWISTLPWGTYTEDNLDLEHARKVLDDDHFDLDKVKERIIEHLAVAKLRNKVSGQILCFVGPPGVGKTSLGQSIARALGRKFVRMSVGGVRDESEIRGHRRTYIGSMPGTIIRSIRDAESANPLLLIDEIDKMGSDWRGDPSSAMLEVLDPEQNSSFRDHYLDLPFDLSKVLFICTANTTDTIPGPLLDRIDVIQLSGYTEAEKLGIAKSYLLPKQLAAHGLKRSQLALSDTMLRTIIREYTREAGRAQPRAAPRRRLPQGGGAGGEGQDAEDARRRPQAARVARPAALLGRGAQAHLGAGRRDRARLHRRPAATCSSSRRPRTRARASCTLTGQLGDVMQESARAALSWVRSHTDGVRRAGGLVREARRPHPRPGRRGAEGRAVGGRDDGDRDRVARARRAGRRRRRHDRRDHAHRPGAADRRASARSRSPPSAPA